MYTQVLVGAALIQGVLSQSNAVNQVLGSRQSGLIDETPRVQYKFPPSRGASALVAGVGPCQGFELADRVDYPISGGVISWSARVDANVQIRYSTSENPTSQDDFRDAITNVADGWSGDQCIDGPNFSELGLSVGDKITMQLYSTAGPNNAGFYECADLRLVSQSDFEKQNLDTSCINLIKTTKTRRDSVSNPKLAEIRTKAQAEALAMMGADLTKMGVGSKSGPLSVTEAGVVGAMVTLGVFMLVLSIGWIAGAISFGKRPQVEHSRKHGSISSLKAASVV